MATLNTLRTKYGIVLSIVIALVLLAFILGDQLGYRQGEVAYDDPTVMVIDGQPVLASEYSKVREQVAYADHAKADVYRMYFGMDNMAMNEDAIAATASDIVLYDKAMAPSFKQLAINVYQNEIDNIIAMQTETRASQLLQQGADADVVTSIIYGEMAMPMLIAEQQIAADKFQTIASAGHYLNKLEVEQMLREEGYSYAGRYIEVPYSSVQIPADAISEEEIAAYYEAHRVENENFGNRTLTYVSIPRVASAEDKAAAQVEADAFANAVATGVEDLESEASKVLADYTVTYRDAASLDEAERTAFDEKGYTELAYQNEAWTMSILLDEITTAESFDVEYAVLPSQSEADAVVEELNGNGGDFAALEIPVATFNETVVVADIDESLVENFAGREVGDIFAYRAGANFVVAKVNAVGDVKDFVCVADFKKELRPSAETLSDINSKVEELMANVGNTVESFNEAVIAAGYQPKQGLVRRQNTMQRGVDGIMGSRNMAIWAYDANIGDKTSMVLNENSYIAMVTSIDENEYEMRDDSAIKRELRLDKQYAAASANLTSIDAVPANGELKEFADITATSIDLEPTLVSAIVASREAGKAVKVRGDAAAYLLVVDAINGDEISAETIAEERQPLTDSYNVAAEMQGTIISLLNSIEIDDMRGVNTL